MVDVSPPPEEPSVVVRRIEIIHSDQGDLEKIFASAADVTMARSPTGDWLVSIKSGDEEVHAYIQSEDSVWVDVAVREGGQA